MADYLYSVRPLGGVLWGLDEFNGSSGIAISSNTRSPDVGAAWVDELSGSDKLVLNGSGLIYPTATGAQLFSKDEPDTADYQIKVEFDGISLSTFDTGYYLAAALRFGGSVANNCYLGGIGFWQYRTSPSLIGPAWCIWRYNSGTLTTLLTPVALSGATASEIKTFTFAAQGNSLVLTTSTGQTLSVTDANLTGAGKAGIYVRGNNATGAVGWRARRYQIESGVPALLAEVAVEATGSSAVTPLAGTAGLAPISVRIAGGLTVAALAGSMQPTAITVSLASGVSLAPAPLANSGTMRSPTVAGASLRAITPLGSVGTLPTAVVRAHATIVGVKLAGAANLAPIAASADAFRTAIIGSPILPAPVALVGGRTVEIVPLAAPISPAAIELVSRVTQIDQKIGALLTLSAPAVLTSSDFFVGPIAAPIVPAPVDFGGGQSIGISPLAGAAGLPSLGVHGDVVVSVTALAAPGLLSILLYDYNFVITPLAAPMRPRFGVVETTDDFLFWTQPLAAPMDLGLDFTVSGDALVEPEPIASPLTPVFTMPTQSQIVFTQPLGSIMHWAPTQLQLGHGAVLGSVEIRLRTFGFALVAGADGGLYDNEAWSPMGPDHESATHPFLTPSRDLRNLISGASLIARMDSYHPPLRIGWISGLGDFFLGTEGLPILPPDDGGTPVTPAPAVTLPAIQKQNPLDLLVYDATDQIVFDSTKSTGYSGQQYGPYLYQHQWETPTGVMAITQRIRFPRPELAYRVPQVIIPSNGILSERVCDVCCRQVASLGLDQTNVSYSDQVDLVAGHNLTIADAGPRVVGISRFATAAVAASPGSGEGRYPGCGDETPIATQLDSSIADPYGVIRMTGDGCYHIRPEIKIVDDEAVVTDGVLLFGNDCKPCCRCQDFADKAVELVALYNELAALSADIEASRDQYAAGITRWNKLNPSQLIDVQFQGIGHNTRYIDAVVQVCYTGDECGSGFTLGMGTQILGGNAENMSFNFMKDQLQMSTPCGGTEQVEPDSARFLYTAGNPVSITMVWDPVSPRSTNTARFRMVFSGVNVNTPTQVRFDFTYAFGPFNRTFYRIVDLVGTSI